MNFFKNLKIHILLLMLVSCGQDFNSNTFDEQLYGGSGIDTSSPAGQRFAAAFEIIDTNCINCHEGYHNVYASYTTSDDWITNGLVVAGDFEGSFLIDKLSNFNGNMPRNGSALSEEDLDTLEAWITNL